MSQEPTQSLNSLTPSQVDQITQEARSWLGTPYYHHGRHKGTACDCVGLIIGVAHQLSISKFNTVEYGRDPNPERMSQLLRENLYSVSTPQAGDIVHLKIQRQPRHLGILVDREGGGLNIIHAYSHVNKVVEHIYDDVWQRITVAGYRYIWESSAPVV